MMYFQYAYRCVFPCVPQYLVARVRLYGSLIQLLPSARHADFRSRRRMTGHVVSFFHSGPDVAAALQNKAMALPQVDGLERVLGMHHGPLPVALPAVLLAVLATMSWLIRARYALLEAIVPTPRAKSSVPWANTALLVEASQHSARLVRIVPTPRSRSSAPPALIVPPAPPLSCCALLAIF